MAPIFEHNSINNNSNNATMRLLTFGFLLTTVLSALLGLDFGQDFIKAALVAPRMPFEIVMSADSKRKDVSGLALKPLGDDIERLFGSQTSSHCTRFPKQCAVGYKQLLGKSVDESAVQHYLQSHPGSLITASKNNINTVSFDIEGASYPIEELLAMNMQNIVSRASELLKEKAPGYIHIHDVAITVPSYFKSSQRNAIKDAAELAGLNVVALVDDGLAIATNYAASREFEAGTEYHVIYDMGAGSTKATLVSFTKNGTEPLEIRVEGYAHDESLGGAYFTNAVAELIKARFLEKHSEIRNSQFQSNERAVAKLFQTAERAKLVLSANSEAPVSIESFYNDIDFKTKIPREEFEEFVSDVTTRITRPLLDSLTESGLTIDQLTSVIYAGGSTRVPLVQRHLGTVVGEQLISKTINADEAAVFGASLRGVQISNMFRVKEFNVIEKSSFTYRVSFDDEKETVVFPKGTPYGTTVQLDVTEEWSENFGFDVIEDAKRYVRYESNSEKLSFNKSECTDNVKYVATFTLTESRLFVLDSLKAQCTTSSPGFLEKLKSKLDSEEEPKERKLTSNITTKPKYLGPRPLGAASKQELKNHLLVLDTKDKQRRLVSEKLNELEAALYSARAYFSDDHIVEQLPEERADTANELITELLEWLDYESDGATIKDIRGKLSSVKVLKADAEKYLADLSVPLDLQAFKSLQTKAVQTVSRFQDSMFNLKENFYNYSLPFEEIGLDFEAEVSKLKFPELISEEKFDQVKGELDEVLDAVRELLNNTEEEVEKIEREKKFEIMSRATGKLSELEMLEKELKTVYTKTQKSLNDVYGKKVRALRRAEKKRAEQEKKEQEGTEHDEGMEVDEEQSEKTDKAEHDEL